MKFKNSIFVILLISGFCLTGCETLKGAGRGLKADVKNTYHNLTGSGNVVKKADDWAQQNLW